ncbi:MAG: hypothetical protein IJM60_04905, partial [Bacteroidales bacterium]|nr:hypothetical protein [Bacteroidales bacterium]
RVTLAEAASAYLSDKFSKSLPSGMKLIMPGIGYSCCPDHSLKRDVLALLPIDIELTDSCAMIPEASVCGFVIAGCNVAYHDIRHLSPEALEDYARRRGMSFSRASSEVSSSFQKRIAAFRSEMSCCFSAFFVSLPNSSASALCTRVER